MKLVRMKLFALLVALSLFANSFGSEEDVLDLGDSDFNTRVAETETTLVMFCKLCKLNIYRFFSLNVHLFSPSKMLRGAVIAKRLVNLLSLIFEPLLMNLLLLYPIS